MIRRISKKGSNGKRAFTLVEIIVVIVVLAVLAAILVPALTGYIKRARRERFVTNATDARIAAQAVMDELYGLGPGAQTGTANQSGQTGGGGSGGDIRWDAGAGARNTAEDIAWGDKILSLMGRGRGAENFEPYLFVFGVGHKSATSLGENAPYTVYYVAYVENEDSPAVFYIDGEWIYEYPRDAGYMVEARIDGVKNKNTLVTSTSQIPLQLYVVSNRTGIADNFWTSNRRESLWGHSASSGFSW